MKKFLRFLILFPLCMSLFQQAKSQTIILDFTNRKVSADGLSWSFDLEAKGNNGYGGLEKGAWVAFNIRMDLQLPPGVTITGGSGIGMPNLTNGIAAVQTSVQGTPPAGKKELGLTLERPDNGTDLNTNTFVKLATYTINFSGPVNQGDPATPRPIPNASGSSWNNLFAEDLKRPFEMAPDFPLPVKLVFFNAMREGNTAQLVWSTSEESNSSHFDLQRSQNGRKWEKIATISAKGESKELSKYSSADPNPLNGINLYRLHMVDVDGSDAYSQIKSLDFDVMFDISLYPNPVSTELKVKTSDFSRISKIQIYNLAGNEVYTSAFVPEAVINTSNLKTGMYLVKVIETNSTVSSYKILVNN